MNVCFQGDIAKAGGVKALVDLIFRWPSSSDGVLVRISHILYFFSSHMEIYSLFPYSNVTYKG